MGPENPERLFGQKDLEDINGRFKKVEGDNSTQKAIDEAKEIAKKGKSPEEQEKIEKDAEKLKEKYEDPK